MLIIFKDQFSIVNYLQLQSIDTTFNYNFDI